MHIWVISSCLHSFLLDTYLRVELLGYRGDLSLALRNTAEQVFKVIAPTYPKN